MFLSILMALVSAVSSQRNNKCNSRAEVEKYCHNLKHLLCDVFVDLTDFYLNAFHNYK